MKETYLAFKGKVVEKAGEVFVGVVRGTMNAESARNSADRARQKYRGLPTDEIAEALIGRAARRTKWEGAANGLAVTAAATVASLPLPEPSHKLAAGAGALSLIVTDLAYTTRVQVQLLLTLAELYECPFDRDDEDDVYLVFKAALGLKGTERVAGYARFAINELARKQFRALLRTGARRAVQEQVTKVAGMRVGRYLGEKYVMRLIPLLNAGLGYLLNGAITRRVGKWGKVKAKLRSSTFRQIDVLRALHPEALVWVLPIIYYVGTSDGAFTENILALYSQSVRRLDLSETQICRVEALIDSADLPATLRGEFDGIRDETVREALYDLALTTAASGLKPSSQEQATVATVGQCLGVADEPARLAERVRYLSR